MRELKFRVWNIEEKCWNNPNILEVWTESGKLEPFSYIKTGKLNPLYVPIENFIIQQFTGLLDINGKEIYEGDICERKNWTGIYYVRWSKDGYFWCDVNEDDEEFYKNRDSSYDADRLRNGINECKIIGNIFENPELIENK